MDTSKEYIEMCKKAEEIQKLMDGADKLSFFYFQDGLVTARAKEEVWLPRQDQLQEMLLTLKYFVKLDRMSVRFYNFCDWFQDSPNRKFNSMEQLWLAFVMWEKYSKKWDGKEWTK